MMNIIFLGAPGTGKGTQAKRLAEYFGLMHLSTGDLLREEIKAKTEIGVKIAGVLSSGGLVSDNLIAELVEKKINLDKYFILDGYPRNLEQAKLLERSFLKLGKELGLVIFFDLSDDVIIKRISGRRLCSKCGEDFNIYSNPSKEDGKCDFCQGDLIIRKDDSESVVRNRLVVYERETKPLVQYYESKGILKHVDAATDVESVFEELVKLIKN